jgi:hypothetical protein
LGIGPNPQSPIPNPQSPIPNPHEKYQIIIYFSFNKKLNFIQLIIINITINKNKNVSTGKYL